MPYSTLTDIQNALSVSDLRDLTADSNSGGVLDTARVTDAIDQADAEINTYIGKKYRVPLDTTPLSVKMWSVRVAIWNLYGRRSEADEMAEKRYLMAIRQLESLVAGDITLDGAAALAGPSVSALSEPQFASAAQELSREQLRGL